MLTYIYLFLIIVGICWFLLGCEYALERLISKKSYLTKNDIKAVSITFPTAGFVMTILLFFLDKNILGILDIWNGRVAILVIAYAFASLLMVCHDSYRRIDGSGTIFHKSNAKTIVLLPGISGLLIIGFIELLIRF